MGCCGCGVGPIGNIWTAVAAVWDLWDCFMDPMGIYGLLSLRCGTYGGSMGCCGCGMGLMGLPYGSCVDPWAADPMGDLWAAVAAVPTLWAIYGLLWLRCQPYGESMGCCGCGVGSIGLMY